MLAPPRVCGTFRSRARIGVVGGPGALEGTFYVDTPRLRSRIEAMGGWSITRGDLGVQVSNYVAGRPPKPQVHEEPFFGFSIPQDATFAGTETIDGVECSKYIFPVKSDMMSYEATLWIKPDPSADPSANAPALPVKLQQQTPSQTMEILLFDVESYDDPSVRGELPESLFEVSEFIPSVRPVVVHVKGTIRDPSTGAGIRGVTLCASRADGQPADWTAIVGGQSNPDGHYSLKLTANVNWTLRVSGPGRQAKMLDVCPAADMLEYDIPLAQGAGVAITPGAMPPQGGAIVYGGGAPVMMATGGAYYGGVGGPVVVGVAPMTAQQLQLAEMNRQAALATTAATLNAFSPLMNAMGGGASVALAQQRVAYAQSQPAVYVQPAMVAGGVVYGGQAVVYGGTGAMQQQQRAAPQPQPQPVPQQQQQQYAPPPPPPQQQQQQPAPAPVAAAAPVVPVAQAKVLTEGVLSKYSMGRRQGPFGINFGSLLGMKNWKSRFFRLYDNGNLAYFEQPTSPKELDLIPLRGPYVRATVIARPTKADHPQIDESKYDMTVKIVETQPTTGAAAPTCKEFTLLLRASSEEERRQWVAALSQASAVA